MNWRNNLLKTLEKRRIDNDIDFQNIIDVEEKIILPILLDISNELRTWYHIQSDVKDNELKLYYGESGCWFKLEVVITSNCEVQVSAYIFDVNDPNLEPGEQPTLIKCYSTMMTLEQISAKRIADIFINSFKTMAKYYI